MLEKLKQKINTLKVKSDEFLDNVKLPENLREERLTLCKNCEFFFEPTTTCSKCGCFMTLKTYMPFASCPVGKWGIINIIKE